jgi:hypothetical protein
MVMVEGEQGELNFDEELKGHEFAKGELREEAEDSGAPVDRAGLGQADEAKRKDIRERAAAILKRLGDYSDEVNSSQSPDRRGETSEILYDPIAAVDAELANRKLKDQLHDEDAARIRAERAAGRLEHQEVDRVGHDDAVAKLREAERLRQERAEGQDAG